MLIFAARIFSASTIRATGIAVIPPSSAASWPVRQSPQTFPAARRQHVSVATIGVMIRETKTAARCTNLPNIAASVTSIQCFCSPYCWREFPSLPSALCDSPPSVQRVYYLRFRYASNFRRPGRALRSLSLLPVRYSSNCGYPVVYFSGTLYRVCLVSSGYAQSLTSGHVGAHIRRDPGGIIAKELNVSERIGSMAITGLPDFFS